jgi:DNA ligase-1
MRFRELVDASRAVAATGARGGKVAILAELFRRLPPEEVAPAVGMLLGDPRQGQLGVGWASLASVPQPAAQASLSVGEVDRALSEIAACSGPGSRAVRLGLLGDLFRRADADEQALLAALIGGEVRQGALAGVMGEAVARAAGVAPAALRRALMLRGDLGAIAELALAEGAAGLAGVGLEVGRPVLPMLASTAEDVAAALARTGPAGVEWKLDGVRAQIHREGDDVAVFSRSLDDITEAVPELAATARSLPVHAVVLDGEALALRADGRPHPFQVTAARAGTRVGIAEASLALPLSLLAFDVLHLDGEDLIDRPGSERDQALRLAVPGPLRVPRIVTEDPSAAEAFFATTLDRGHEGVMVKALDAPYEAGGRGARWLKVKPVHTLDLVVLAAEWGHGRRRGTLSNLHLGARDPAGGHVMLGKTFKGLTDAMLAWQTERLLELEVSRDRHVVHVRPELVVEVAFDGVQASSRYPGGVALRFARVRRHRPDKPAAEADTVDDVRAIHARAIGETLDGPV